MAKTDKVKEAPRRFLTITDVVFHVKTIIRGITTSVNWHYTTSILLITDMTFHVTIIMSNKHHVSFDQITGGVASSTPNEVLFKWVFDVGIWFEPT